MSDTLRPDWTPVLAHIVGAEAADRVLADPAWPALVAAVTHARRDGWDADQLLTTAHDLLLGGQPEDEPLRPDELATALVWRIGMLTDTAATHDGYLPPEQVDEPPMDIDDLGALPDADAHFDDDWLASLTEPVPGEHEPEPLSREDLAPARDGAAQRYVTDLEDDPIAAIHAALDARDEARDFARAAEEHFWATATVPRDRLVELNSLAEDFFTDHYRDAWAPTYLSERLGTDLTGDARFSVGYAPARWTALTDHLRRQGATDEEIVGAGLGRIASTGRVIDQFRDRLVFPIKNTNTDGDPEILGWIGRRNPAHDGDDDNAGPKYLNTAETDLFRKGNELYGLAEATPALADGAAVVLVEGPMDAIAVTLAGDGDFVGVAPLGTAFTDTQADKLRPHIGAGKPDPIVATDADAAGQKAAYRAFWQLAARTADPNTSSSPTARTRPTCCKPPDRKRCTPPCPPPPPSPTRSSPPGSASTPTDSTPSKDECSPPAAQPRSSPRSPTAGSSTSTDSSTRPGSRNRPRCRRSSTPSKHGPPTRAAWPRSTSPSGRRSCPPPSPPPRTPQHRP